MISIQVNATPYRSEVYPFIKLNIFKQYNEKFPLICTTSEHTFSWASTFVHVLTHYNTELLITVRQ